MAFEHVNNEELVTCKELVEKYRPITEKLITYLSWLESRRNTNSVSQTFAGEGIGEHSIPFPVYDSTLMSLVKLLQTSDLIDRNYPYVYSRNRIRTVEDEIRLIRSSEFKDINNIGAILSKYVLEGMRKGTRWSEAVTNGIFYEAITKMRSDIEYWDVPIH